MIARGSKLPTTGAKPKKLKGLDDQVEPKTEIEAAVELGPVADLAGQLCGSGPLAGGPFCDRFEISLRGRFRVN